MVLALLNGLAGFLTIRSALSMPDVEFVKRGIGGLAVRLLCIMVVLVLTMTFLPIHVPAFVSAFVTISILALLIEVTVLHRRVSSAAL